MNDNNKLLTVIGSILLILSTIAAGFGWIYGVSATANRAMSETERNARALEKKADLDDIQRLEREVRELRRDIEDPSRRHR